GIDNSHAAKALRNTPPFSLSHTQPYAFGGLSMRSSSKLVRTGAVCALLAAGALAADLLAQSGSGPAAPVPALLPAALPAQPLDGIALAAPDAAAVSVPSSPNAWGGARTGLEPTLSDRVVQYDIDATLDPDKHVVDGREKLT